VFYRFSDDQDIVVDFSAGYGGRMLGALSMARHYIGIEPCGSQISGLRSMLDGLRREGGESSTEVLPGCAEDVMPLLPKGTAGLVFSSPPYFN
jgi:hypothetical protein